MNPRNDAHPGHQQAGEADGPEHEIFRAVLTPHRSLPPLGFLIVMALLAGCSFVGGMIFLLRGAWPVMGFFALDVALVYLAFRLSYRQARAFEDIRLTGATLTVTRVDPRGRGQRFAFNPYWVRIEVDRHPEWGVIGLRLAEREARLPVGGFLNPDDRESFARALSGALSAARAGRDA